MKSYRSIWQPLFRNSKFRIQFFITILLLALALFAYRNFLDFAEARSGTVLSDPILKLYNPVDLTWLIFAMIYIGLIAGIVVLSKNPEKLLLAFQTYTALIVVRIIAMYLVPLEAPETLIVLKDPFVEFFGSGESLTKDLFFSGHTATLFMLSLVIESKPMKYIFLISAAFVGISIVLQHVHYVIDVLAAPFFTYACYTAISSLELNKLPQ
jgi:membrane-associated phospholipid phosphatase